MRGSRAEDVTMGTKPEPISASGAGASQASVSTTDSPLARAAGHLRWPICSLLFFAALLHFNASAAIVVALDLLALLGLLVATRLRRQSPKTLWRSCAVPPANKTRIRDVAGVHRDGGRHRSLARVIPSGRQGTLIRTGTEP